MQSIKLFLIIVLLVLFVVGIIMAIINFAKEDYGVKWCMVKGYSWGMSSVAALVIVVKIVGV